MSTVENEIENLRRFGESVCSDAVGSAISDYCAAILAAVEAERREWRKEQLTWERRVKMAADMAKAKAFDNNQNKED